MFTTLIGEKIIRIEFRLLSVAFSICLSSALHADPLRYHFNGESSAYMVTIKAEMPDRDEIRAGPLTYKINSVDSQNGQITFDCDAVFNMQVAHSDRLYASNSLVPEPRGYFNKMYAGEINTLIDLSGRVIHKVHQTPDLRRMPFLLDSVGNLLVQPMSQDDRDTWKIDRAVTLSRYDPVLNPDEKDDNEYAARQLATFVRKQVSGNLVTIDRHDEVTTEEIYNGKPVEKITGDTEFIFDAQAGLIKSLDMTETIALHKKGVTLNVPVTVTATLLTGDALIKWKAEKAAEDAVASLKEKQMQDRFNAEQANAINELPAHSSKTDMVGADGGGPFMRAHHSGLPVIGFTVRIGSWGHTTIGSAIPLFEKPADLHPADATVCLAKDGYVVGGVIVNSIDGTDGLQIVFMRKTTAGVDPKDSYKSEWFGESTRGKQTQLDGKGKLIIGTCGFQGLNVAKIGLIVDDGNASVPKNKTGR